MAVLVDWMQVEWPLLVLDITPDDIDYILSCHNVPVNILLAVRTVESPNVLSLANKVLAF